MGITYAVYQAGRDMSATDYIRKERTKIRRECEKLGITPLEWIAKYAQGYFEENRDNLDIYKLPRKKNHR